MFQKFINLDGSCLLRGRVFKITLSEGVKGTKFNS